MSVGRWLLVGWVVGTLLIGGGPWFIAYARRRVLRRWEPSPEPASREWRFVADVYGPVWFSHHVPHASWRPYKWLTSGAVYFTDTQAEFVAVNGQTTILNTIQSVDLGGGFGRNPFTATWVKISYVADGTTPRVAYVNDARWFGWRPLLTRSSEDLANALVASQLRGSAPASDPRI